MFTTEKKRRTGKKPAKKAQNYLGFTLPGQLDFDKLFSEFRLSRA